MKLDKGFFNNDFIDKDCFDEDFIEALKEDVSDPTGLKRYFDIKSKEDDLRYKETKRMNYIILCVSIISAIIGLIGLLK